MGWSTHFRAVAIAAAVSAIIAFGATSPAAGAEIVPTPSSAPDDAAHLSEPVEPTGGAPVAGEPAVGSAEVSLQAAAASVITPFGPGVHRLSGGDRYQTAVAISQRFGAGVPILYVATAADFPDALTAAAAAAHLGGPLLLTRADALPDVVRTEIARLAPKRIVVAGGESVVGTDVYDDLATMTPSITRLGGSDRYETGALLISDAFTSATQAFVATGRDFPDALAASAAAGYLGAPVFLVDGQSAFAPTYATASMASLGVGTVRIAGAGGAVSLAMEADLITRGFDVMRHEGTDRYVTAAAINKAVFRGISPGSAFIATGADFADALAGAALAGGLNAPLFLTRGTCIPPLVADSMDVLAPAARVILGGPGAVGETVAQDTVCGMGWVKPAAGRITDVFGPRAPICTPGGCSQSFHRGVDLGTGCWSPIYAASDGRVTTAGRVGTYGNFVKISHGSGIDTGYAHLVDGGTLVSVGQLVTAGDQIGWSGATGAAFGCHLHFEVYQGGVQIDPLPFMSARGITLG